MRTFLTLKRVPLECDNSKRRSVPKAKRYGEEEEEEEVVVVVVVVVVVGVEGETGCRPYEHGRRDSHALQVLIYRIPPVRDDAVVQAGAQNSVKKGAHSGPSNEDESSCETRDTSRSTLCSPVLPRGRQGVDTCQIRKSSAKE